MVSPTRSTRASANFSMIFARLNAVLPSPPGRVYPDPAGPSPGVFCRCDNPDRFVGRSGRMNPLLTASIVLALILGGILAGTALRKALPDAHLSPESKDVIRLGSGLVATMAALVLSLLISSAK